MSVRQKEFALIVSISLNLFLVGAAITIYTLRETEVHAVAGQRALMRAAGASLDQAHRTAFLRLLHREGETIQAETRSARSIRDDAWTSLAARNFDPDVTKRRLAQARELNALAHGSVENAVVDFAAGLAPPQRSSFGQAMRRAALHQRMDPVKSRPSEP